MKKLYKQAFTLIELLVVIAIIGILSGLIVVSMGGMITKASIAKSQVFSNSLRNSLMMNLVSERDFNGTTSDGVSSTNADVIDAWSGSNNGSVTIPARTHTPTVRTGSNCVDGSCLEFNGSSDYVNCGVKANLNIIGAVTIGAWVKTAAEYVPVTGNFYYDNVGDQQGYRLDLKTGGGARMRVIPSTEVVSPIAVNDNKWHYLVGTYSPSAFIKIYVDGALSNTNSTSIPSTITSSTHDFNIGFNYVNGSNFFTGLIDDVRVYNAALPTSQIKEQYYAGLNSLLANGSIDNEEYISRINNYASSN